MNSMKSQTLIHDSRTKIMTTKEIQDTLDKKMNELLDCQKCGNYVKADQIKANIQQLKKQLTQNKLNQMIQHHNHLKKTLEQTNLQEITLFTQTWNDKMQQFNCQKHQLQTQMKSKHQQELKKTKVDLQNQIPNKLKESSQCLNFRKIEEQMIKQKKYSQAHKIQQRITELETKQKQSFEKQRQVKIQTALKALKNKQKTQIQALNKKIQTGHKELIKQKQKELQKIKLKHINSAKDILSQQQKQLLGEKGQIKSRVSISTCRSRSKLTSASKRLI